MRWPYKNSRGEPARSSGRVSCFTCTLRLSEPLCSQRTRSALLVLCKHFLIQMHVHACTHTIRAFVSLCGFFCAEISVLLQSPASRVPRAPLRLRLTGLDVKPTWGTLTQHCLENTPTARFQLRAAC